MRRKKGILLLQGRAECLIEENAVEKLHEISEIERKPVYQFDIEYSAVAEPPNLPE